ncbi:extracellular solute-binding protein [Evansella cellulosilytica]|uniref:Maltodextrin-binding protein n=1 Tax=Evansella cellulosilytica (strain ATCC 21833 / DSM 2522 / FERM P-1141 / JCM 9156 / N-4) TaxID=649639 RepID=E6TY03_EVAC2|nr:extracellular solute-binding protein [Evansella cellulosilytica]ADU31216.1 extracellular solute-binding protein family 1 [Evansella cellulosilytica DSM 2522]
MYKKKLLIMTMMMLTLMLVAVGCGRDAAEPVEEDESTVENGSDVTEETSDDVVPEKPESLEIWANNEEYQFAAIEHLVKQFEEEHGIEVLVTPYLMADQDEAFELDGPSGIGPDLIFQPHDRLGNLVTQNLLAPLEADEATLAEYTEDAIIAFTLDGEVYGAPLVMENTALYYNKDIISEVPETMEELYELAEELTDASNDEYGFLFEALNFYHVFPWMGGYGGYVFPQDAEGNYDPTDLGLNNEGSVEAFAEVQSLFERGLIPRSITEDVLNGLFTDGKVGAVLSGPWYMASFSDALGDSLGVAPLPTLSNGEDPTPFAGVKGWLVSNYTEHTYWASQLALHLTSADSQAYYFEETGEIPARPDADIDHPLAEGFLDQSQSAIPMPNIPEMGQVWDPMEDAVQFNADGDDPKEILDEAVEDIFLNIDLMQ